MTTIVDASVAVKWVLPEWGADEAVALREDKDLIAPALILAEIGSAVWKSFRRGDLSSIDAQSAVRVAAGHLNRLISIETLIDRATELALDLRHPIYDCFYLALALRENAPVVSADARLRAAAEQAGVTVRMIGIQAP